MTDEVISKLPEVLRGNICTLKRASGDTTNNEYMCESGLKVINFDKIPDEYARGKGSNSKRFHRHREENKPMDILWD